MTRYKYIKLIGRSASRAIWILIICFFVLHSALSQSLNDYDARNQLIRSENENLIIDFSYDPNGNRIGQQFVVKRPQIDLSTNSIQLGLWDASCSSADEQGFFVYNRGNKKLILSEFRFDDPKFNHSFSPNDTILPSDSSYYTVTVERADTFSTIIDTLYISGHNNQDTFVVVTSYPPEPVLGMDISINQLVCVGASPGQIEIQAYGGWPPYSIFTNFINSGSIVNVTNPNWLYIETYDAFDCLVTDSIYIGVAGPELDLGDTVSGCGIVELSPQQMYDSYQWSTGSSDPSIMVQNDGYYWLQADSAGCEVYDTVFVDLVDFTYNSIEEGICEDGSYILPSGTEVNAPGVYLDTIPGLICDSVLTITLELLPGSVFPAFTAAPNDLQVVFDNTSEFILEYFWDFGDGNHSTEEEPVHLYDDYAVYQVCLFGYGACDTSQFCRDVEVFDPGIPCDRTGDSLTLYDLYVFTNGLGWIDPWNVSLSIDYWDGVILNGQGCVSRLDLPNRNLNGELPNSIGDFSLLNDLNLSFNSLVGRIPAEIGNLSMLTKLVLANNNLDSQLPQELFDATSLTWLDLSSNSFAGDIPSNITQASQLEFVDLRNNNFSSLPDLSSLSGSLDRLLVNNNRLTFDDLLPNMNVAATTFSYIPQASVGSATIINVLQGDDLVIDIGIDEGLNSNEYKWFKDNVEIVVTGINELDLSPVHPSDAGVYTCEVTNSNVPGLTLYSLPVTVNVTACSPDTSQMTVYTCNPDNAGNIDTLIANCEEFITQIYELVADFQIDLGDSIISGCDSVQLLDNNFNNHPNAEYIWSTGGIGHVEYVYESNVYHVIATLDGGCTDTDTVVAKITPAPVAAFTYDQAGNNIAFVNTSTNATAFTWDFADGTISSEISPTHTYSQDGLFEVSLIAISDCGNDTIIQNIEIVGTGLNNSQTFNVGVFPNPNEGNFQINIFGLANQLAIIRLIDSVGKEIFRKAIFIGENNWSGIYDLMIAPGIYQVILQAGADIAIAPIVVY